MSRNWIDLKIEEDDGTVLVKKLVIHNTGFDVDNVTITISPPQYEFPEDIGSVLLETFKRSPIKITIEIESSGMNFQ